jgi:flavin-dependent dehydrogenase
VVRIFIVLKNSSSSAGFEPANLGSYDKHYNYNTTEDDLKRLRNIEISSRKNWKEYVDRIPKMIFDRFPKMILKYQPKGKRNLGIPLKRWKDSVLKHP